MGVEVAVAAAVAAAGAAAAKRYESVEKDKAEKKAANQRREAEAKANQQAIDAKKSMFAEQESQAARPIQKTYLGSGGTSGGYVDENEIKAKKRLGGSK